MAYVLTTNSVPLNQWTHVAGTYDGSGLRVYLNGVLDASGAYANGIFPGTIDLGIGGVVGAANPGDVISQFSGQIDEPSIYNRALSATEIQTIYNAGGAGKYNPNCVSASTNAVGWWGGDGNAYDLAHTNMGTLQNGATFASGEVGQGFKFDGVDDYVRIENNSDLNPTNQLTLECWVFLDSYYYDNYALIRKDGECANRQYMLTASPAGTFRAHLGIQSGGYNYVDSSIFPQEKTWYHLAETYDGTNLCLYINGVLDSSTNLTGQIVTTSEPLCIGGTAPNGCREYFTGGLIDEPAVYNRALSATEIGAIYSAGCAGKCKVDSDSDGLTDLQEAFLGTNPNNPDTDGDGLTDGDEVFVYHTNPNSQDSDGDGVIDQPFGIFITRPRTGSSLP